MNYYNPYQGYFQNPAAQPAAVQTPAVQAQPQSQNAVPQVQSGGFLNVRNETEARNYPVAYGNSVTFKDENAPYIYVKTMGFSQLDSPTFDKYRLVKEEAAEAPNLPQNEPIDIEGINTSMDDLKGQIKAIWAEIEGIKKKPSAKPAKKKEVDDDDTE